MTVAHRQRTSSAGEMGLHAWAFIAKGLGEEDGKRRAPGAPFPWLLLLPRTVGPGQWLENDERFCSVRRFASDIVSKSNSFWINLITSIACFWDRSCWRFIWEVYDKHQYQVILVAWIEDIPGKSLVLKTVSHRRNQSGNSVLIRSVNLCDFFIKSVQQQSSIRPF